MLSASKQSSPEFLPTPGEIHNLCAWLDKLPLSRPKRHLARDFSDGGKSFESCTCVSQKLISKRWCPTGLELSSLSCDPRLFGVDAARPSAGLTSYPHISKTQHPNVDSLSESQSCGEQHYIPESWARDDRELANLQKRTGLQSPPTYVSMKTLQNQKDSEKMGCCACRGDPVEGFWDDLTSIQQQLEDKEQAIAILQETVKILQMKVIKLEHLVQLKDQRIWKLMRSGPEEHQIWRGPHPESLKP
ncbi:sperm flagellar protein 1-like isoform X2 [Psammomys obesus]|uniref:sperm flagellar protein 1-like isoform X2 n=1 Tax=Psammomys obesus TaxID=48139 RepID=UPI002452E90E|nr:sperm flagellar protein 1-like isoform X2 [Psammomys obesus]